MAEFYFTAKRGNDSTLHIAPLTDRLIARSGQDVPDPSGYFLFERRHADGPAEVEIIAQLVSEDAALKLREILEME